MDDPKDDQCTLVDTRVKVTTQTYNNSRRLWRARLLIELGHSHLPDGRRPRIR